jgi:uncharacterized RDD family membrane protein YckC
MTDEPDLAVRCPLCQKSDKELRERLYRVPICRRCSNEFTKLRVVAGFIDWFVLLPALFLGVSLAWLVCVGIVESTTDIVVIDTDSPWEEPKAYYVEPVLRASGWLIPVLSYLLFCAKDGFSGYSPGKIWLELRVVDQKTGAPIGFVQSIKRNFAPAAFCLLAAFALVQLRYGPRVGDEIGKTKVIWRRYLDRQPFLRLTKEWVGEPTTQPESAPRPVEDHNPYRAPQG